VEDGKDGAFCCARNGARRAPGEKATHRAVAHTGPDAMVRTDKAVNARLSLYPPEGDTTYAPTVQLQLALLIGRKAGKIGGIQRLCGVVLRFFRR
jgi:hypothetical protein